MPAPSEDKGQGERIYTIGQLCEFLTTAGFQATPRIIRYMEDQGLISAPSRRGGKAGGARVYTEEQVKRIKDVLWFREFGFPLDMVSTLMDLEAASSEDALAAMEYMMLRARAATAFFSIWLQKTMPAIQPILRPVVEPGCLPETATDIHEIIRFYAARDRKGFLPIARVAAETARVAANAHDLFEDATRMMCVLLGSAPELPGPATYAQMVAAAGEEQGQEKGGPSHDG
ncbi:MerR family transcriptional regulator [Planctomycetota bacterium]